ncbi:hypothetical protein MFIFM68171_02114 [Madurella fahalii]|uniref:Uncharacterized protein n=1 Tax=Madurella fahalii TaxID=1157608 RepID=A0ABQ0G2G1_9PEZI
MPCKSAGSPALANGGHSTANCREKRHQGRDVFLCCIVTRDPKYGTMMLEKMGEEEFEDPKRWVQHSEVELDNHVSVFFEELMA